MAVIGLGIFAIATWFASRPPALPAASLAAATAASSTPVTPLPAAQIKKNNVAGGAAAVISITLTGPTSGAQWAIGTQHTISWNKSAGVTGQMYLVNATSGAIVGWIQQNVAPKQVYFPWNTRDVFLSGTNPAEKDVLPGKYVIKMSFTAPNVPPAVSAPFFIISAQPQ